MNTIKCPYCAEDIKTDAKLCKHCGKKVILKLKSLEEAKKKQEKYDERKKTFIGRFINKYLEHGAIYTIFIIVSPFAFISMQADLENTKKTAQEYSAISEVNKNPTMSCNHAKKEIQNMKGDVSFYGDCNVSVPGAYRDYVVGSFVGSSYLCDVMYFEDGGFSKATCRIY